MSLSVGSRIGPYEITAQIGVGGMGEVYRATDTNLGRQVAIKVLPDAFAQDNERLARFEREAKTLASLNHPNIAIIHGFEKSDGVRALVMELVDGPTLADRIGQGPIPIDEALPIARQIAEALEAAHEQSIRCRYTNSPLKVCGSNPAIRYRPHREVETITVPSSRTRGSAGPRLASVPEGASKIIVFRSARSDSRHN